MGGFLHAAALVPTLLLLAALTVYADTNDKMFQRGPRLSKSDLQFLFGDKSPEDAYYVTITINSRRKRDTGDSRHHSSTFNEEVNDLQTMNNKIGSVVRGAISPSPIDPDGLAEANLIEEFQPDFSQVLEVETANRPDDEVKDEYGTSNAKIRRVVKSNIQKRDTSGSVQGGDSSPSQGGRLSGPGNDNIDALVVEHQKEYKHQREEVLSDIDDSDLQKMMLDMMKKPVKYAKKAVINNNVIKTFDVIGNQTGEPDIQESNTKENQNSSASAHSKNDSMLEMEELQITIKDTSGAIKFNLRPNTDLFSPNFKVVVRDGFNTTKNSFSRSSLKSKSATAKLTDEERGTNSSNNSIPGDKMKKSSSSSESYAKAGEAGQVVEVRRSAARRNCVYVGESLDDPRIAVALSNCDGFGFTGMLINGDTTHLIRPALPVNERRRRRDVTENQLHILHSTSGSSKCGIYNLQAMKAPRYIVELTPEERANTTHQINKRRAYYNSNGGPSVIRLPYDENDGMAENNRITNDWLSITSNSVLFDEGAERDIREEYKRLVDNQIQMMEEAESSDLPHDKVVWFKEQTGSSDYRRRQEVPGDFAWEVGGGRRSGRVKRDLDQEYEIETAVFVDDVMYDFVAKREAVTGNDIINMVEDIVYAIMNGVYILYRFPSMTVPLSVTLVRLDILKSSSAGPAKAGGEIEGYLSSFCSWQSRLNRQLRTQEADHIFWDHGLLLSGLDLYSGTPDDSSVIGLAWVAAMCNPTYSCTINEGTSFEAVYVITHEMGHSLGMSHDGSGEDNNKCDKDKFIMSASTGPGKVTWSTCSNDEVKAFLQSDKFTDCLVPGKKATLIDYASGPKLPGQHFPIAVQCSYALGSSFTPYTTSKHPYNNICRETWCQNKTHAMRTHPALEGTACEPKKVCSGGVCMLQSDVEANMALLTPARGNRAASRPPSTPRTTTTTPPPPPARSPRSFSLTDLLQRIRDMFRNYLHRDPSGGTGIDLSKSLDNHVTRFLTSNLSSLVLSTYGWVLRNVTTCSVMCGGGYVTADVACVNVFGLEAHQVNGTDEGIASYLKSFLSSSGDVVGGGVRAKRSVGSNNANDVEMMPFDAGGDSGVGEGGSSSLHSAVSWMPFTGTSSQVEPDAVEDAGTDAVTHLSGSFMFFNGTGGAVVNITRPGVNPLDATVSDTDAEPFLCESKERPPSKWACNVVPCGSIL